MRKIHLFAIALISLVHYSFIGLSQGFEVLDIPFYKAGNLLVNSGHPGIDATFPARADLNNNGELDLILYSLITGTTHTYLKTESGYEFTRAYKSSFPVSYSWSYYEDINCDGIEDRISYYDSFSLSVEYGEYLESGLTFLDSEIINFNASSPLFDPLDIPIFFDEDDDGDIDIISSPLPGTSLHLYTNSGIGCSFDSFSLSHQCWGDFSMSYSSDSIFLNSGCPQRIGEIAEPNEAEQMHYVPTFQIWDYENDGDMDLFIGNSLGSRLELLVNDGFNIFTEHVVDLDFLDIQVDASERPIPFFLDFDDDGLDDLIVHKSLFSDNESDFSWQYQADVNGQFSLVSQNSLNSLGPDLGSQIYPVWNDVNGDGLIDIVYSNLGRDGENEYSSLRWLQNTGTVFSPEYDIIENELISIQTLELSEVRFTFGHIDDDGFEDLFITSYLGESFYILDWRNNLTSDPVSIDLNFQGSDFSPLLIDINEDGVDDLLLGERNGNINYLENNILNGVNFSLITESFGNISTQIDNYPWGESFLSKKYDLYGNLLLYVMDSKSQISSYLIDSVDPNSSIPSVENIGLSYYSNSLCGQSLKDINSDGIDDLIIGHLEGGIEILSQDTDTSSSQEILIENTSISIAPNPFSDILTIKSNRNEVFIWTIYDLNGKEITSNKDSNVYVLNTEFLSPGLYVLKINANHSQIIVKQ